MKFFSEFIWLLRKIVNVEKSTANYYQTFTNRQNIISDHASSPPNTQTLTEESLWFQTWE